MITAIEKLFMPSELSLGNAAEAFRQVKSAKALLEDCEAKIHAFVHSQTQQGKMVEGIYLEPGSMKRSIKDAQKTYEALSKELSVEEFTSCCNVGIAKLEKVFLKKQQALDEKSTVAFSNGRLDAILTENECLEVKQSAPSLRLVPQELLTAK